MNANVYLIKEESNRKRKVYRVEYTLKGLANLIEKQEAERLSYVTDLAFERIQATR